MLALFNRVINWLTPSTHSDLEHFIQLRQPKTAGDLDKLIQEFSYKKQGGWL